MSFVKHIRSKSKTAYDTLSQKDADAIYYIDGDNATATGDEQIIINGKNYSGVRKVEAGTNGKVKVDGTSVTVYEHPTTTAADAAAVKVGKDANGHVVLGGALTYQDVGAMPSGAVTYNQGVVTINGSSFTPLTSHQSLSGYATETWVNNKFDDMLGINADAVSTLKSVLSDDDKTTGILVQIAGKVDKEAGKGLSTNDYSAAEKSKVESAYSHSLSSHARIDATKVEASTTNGYIKINGTETKVYTHPAPTTAEVKAALGTTGSSSAKFLCESGGWEVPPSGITSVCGLTKAAITADDIAGALENKGYELTDTTYNAATTSAAGLMSATDKANLNALVDAMTWG